MKRQRSSVKSASDAKRAKVMSRPFVHRAPVSKAVTTFSPRNYRGSGQREIKFVDIPVTVLSVRIDTTPPTFVALNMPVQGAAPYNRIGSKILGKSIRIRGFWLMNATGTQDIARVMVVYDRQTNGAAPSYADVITAYAAAGTTTSGCLDGLNMNNRDRFKVLADEQIVLPAITDTAGVLSNTAALDTSGPTNKINFDRFIPLRDLETHFKASAGTVGDIATGGIFITCVTFQNDQKWEFAYTTRYRFDDL